MDTGWRSSEEAPNPVIPQDVMSTYRENRVQARRKATADHCCLGEQRPCFIISLQRDPAKGYT